MYLCSSGWSIITALTTEHATTRVWSRYFFSLLLVDLSIGWQWKCQQNCIVKKWRHPALLFMAVGTGGTGGLSHIFVGIKAKTSPLKDFRLLLGRLPQIFGPSNGPSVFHFTSKVNSCDFSIALYYKFLMFHKTFFSIWTFQTDRMQPQMHKN